jgi:NhaA family Na+:H+ antiporter
MSTHTEPDDTSEPGSTSDRRVTRVLARPIQRFLAIESAGGIVLLLGAAVAMVWANAPWSSTYAQLWERSVGLHTDAFVLDLSVREWINDGAMALFFFVVGMEIKREVLSGELREAKAAALPVLAAVGGMVVPAIVFTLIARGGSGSGGWGIPMATDIAFAVGVVSLLGTKVPAALKVFLLTLAVADDLGAILVIAAVYSHGIEAAWLAVAAAVLTLVFVLYRRDVWSIPVHVVLALVTWYAMLRSGVHATVAGVLLGFLVPARARRTVVTSRAAVAPEPATDGAASSTDPAALVDPAASAGSPAPLDVRLADRLHPWTGFVVIPLFALANAGVPLGGDALGGARSSRVAIAIVVGLVLGKTVGVLGVSFVATRLGVARLPAGVSWLHMLGISAATGIGFTIAIFMTNLSLADAALRDQAKIGVFVASLVAALLATIILSLASRRPASGKDLPLGWPSA